MKDIKKVVQALLFTFCASGISALETGGLITNNTKIDITESDNVNLNQKDRASLWLKAPVSMDGQSYFIGEALYEFEYDKDEDSIIHTVDSDLLKLVLTKNTEKGKLLLSAGRFFGTDISGYVYGQNADGLLLDYSGEKFGISLYGAYTGLLNSHTTTMISSDTFGGAGFENDDDVLYCLAEKYAVSAFTVRLPDYVKNHSLSAQFLGTFRLEDEDFNRLYGSVCFNGALTPALYYNAGTTFGFMTYDSGKLNVGNLSKLNLTYFIKKIPSSVSVNAVYASGEQGELSSFLGFTKAVASYSQDEPLYSGIIKAGLKGTVKPVSNLLLYAGADVLFDAADGDENDKIAYSGLQYQAGADWQVFSDLKFGASLCQYFDKDNDDSKNKTAIQIKAVLSF